MKILIVEDNEILAELLKQTLETEEEYQVKTAGNGDEGYRAFLKFKPDIIVTDIEMPIKNGLEMVREIRALDPEIKTIYMSASPDRYQRLLENEKNQYKAAFLRKPLHMPEMAALFQEYYKASAMSG